MSHSHLLFASLNSSRKGQQRLVENFGFQSEKQNKVQFLVFRQEKVICFLA